MRLELETLRVTDVQWGESTGFADGILTVNKVELAETLMKDSDLGDVTLELVRPGESVRIIPVKDVIQPRCKLEGPGEVFPGFIGDVETVGEGRTRVLEGMGVVTCGQVVGFQEGIIDMTGPGAEYTPFSANCNLVVVLETPEGMEKHHCEACYRLAGLKTAHYLAAATKEVPARETKTIDMGTVTKTSVEMAGLPRVGYLYMLQSQGLLHDTYVYGVDAKRILPTLLSPTEVMDGAIVSGNCVSACDKNSTSAHQNNPVISSLLEKHGREIEFAGCIITNENVTLMDKKRSSSFAVKLARLLGLDGIVISEEGFGNPDADLIMNCTKAEKASIRTVLITDEFAGTDGASQSLADAAPQADAVVTAGNANEIIVLPPMERIIGFVDAANIIAGGSDHSLRPDGSIEVELQAITGATSELGLTRLSAVTL
jgi:glycine reductase